MGRWVALWSLERWAGARAATSCEPGVGRAAIFMRSIASTLYLLWLYLLWLYLLWRPGGQYVLEQVDSVELEQLALLFSRLDTDHDGVLMFGEFLPVISLVYPS